MTNKNAEELQIQIQYALVEKLSSSQRRQSKLVDLLGECVFESDKVLTLSYVNQAWLNKLGYEQHDLIGKKLTDMVQRVDQKQALSEALESVEQEQRPASIELQLTTACGSLSWFELRLTQGGETGLIGLLFDVNRSKELEQQLILQEEHSRRLSLVASHTTNMVVITNRNGEIEWVNDSFIKGTGYSLMEVLGKKPGTFLQGEDTDPLVVKQISAAIKKGAPFNVEIVNYDKQCKPYWVMIDATPVTNKQGEISHYIAIESDITQRVVAEQNAAEIQYNYYSVVDNIPDVVLRICPKGKLLFVNHAWHKQLGFSREQSIGVDVSHFLSQQDHEALNQVISGYINGERESIRLDLQLKKSDSSYAWFEMTLTPIQQEDKNTLTSIAATLIDVNDRIKTTEELEKAKEQAESLSEAKSRFMANISHEIRTPLNAVIGSADLLHDTGLTREQSRYAKMIKTSGSALLSLLDDVLTYSRYDAGVVSNNVAQFELDVCLEEAIDIVSESAVSKGLQLILDIDSKCPLTLSGDMSRIRQILLNLLANAIKFTDHGFIAVRVTGHCNNNGQFELQIEVEDTGIGISSEKLNSIFDPFVQSDASETRQFGGSGLGLAICKQICNVVGGAINVTSTIGKGSVFSVVYPLQKVVGEGGRESSPYQETSKFKFCIVGKNKRLNSAVANMLGRYDINYSVMESAQDIPSGVEHVSDLFFVTSASELEDCRLILGQASVNERCVLIYVSLLTHGRDVERSRANEIIVNGPFKLSHLAKALEFLEEPELGLNSARKDWEAEQEPLPDCSGKTVLIVEDNENNHHILRELISQTGGNTHWAKNGEEALRALSTREFDLVLMDIQMPVMDGITATDHIRKAEESYKNIPIIAVTANAIHGDKERFIAAGMNDYISKPVAREKLHSILLRYLYTGATQSMRECSTLPEVWELVDKLIP